jgi:MFS family permease
MPLSHDSVIWQTGPRRHERNHKSMTAGPQNPDQREPCRISENPKDGTTAESGAGSDEHRAGDETCAGSGLLSATFAGFLSTQFLGAFNDNYFKQLVLLTCVGEVANTGKDRQPLALAAFALPFVLLSGMGGYLSDRCAKSRVIVGCKIAEIAVMGMALVVMLIPGLTTDLRLLLLISVLALMGAHSAIFGPSKYGSLPELFRPDVLLPVNGYVQMTTFLAIIFGTVAAGVALDQLNRDLWMGSMVAVGIAVAGTLTALFIRRTRPSQPQLKLSWENLAIPSDVWRLLRSERGLMLAVLVASLFWFVGGVAQPAVNALGKNEFQLSDTRTSMMTAGLGVGIAVGCMLVGILARGRSGMWVTCGAWGIVLSLTGIGLTGSFRANFGQPDVSAIGSGAAAVSVLETLQTASPLEWTSRALMILLGLSAGIFVVPIQVYIQQFPPAEQKGRVLGVQNLFNWIGILLAAAFVGIMNAVLGATFGATGGLQKQHVTFYVLAIVMVPVAIWYIPGNTKTAEDPGAEATRSLVREQ